MKKQCRFLAVLIFTNVLLGPVPGSSVGAQQQPTKPPAAKLVEDPFFALLLPPSPKSAYEFRLVCLNLGEAGTSDRLARFRKGLDIYAKQGLDLVETIPAANRILDGKTIHDCKLVVFRRR
jgi:hypothetical protein